MDSSFSRSFEFWRKSRKFHWPLWATLTAALLFAGFVLKPLAVDTNIMSVLPDFGLDSNLDLAERKMGGASNGAFYLLVADKDFAVAKDGARAICQAIGSHPEVESLTLDLNEASYSSFSDYLFDSRYTLLPEDVRKNLAEGKGAKVAQNALQEIFSPVSTGTLNNLDLDPFALSSTSIKSFLGSGLLQGLSVSPRDGVLATQKNGQWYVLVLGRLKGASVGSGSKHEFIPQLHAVCDRLMKDTAGLRVIYSGVPFHTYESSQSAQAQVAVISLVASILTLVLAYAFFRSVIPLAATLFSLLAGIAAALASTNLIFGQVHIFTLLFGTSIIGNAVDFALLFFAEWKNPSESGDGSSTLKRVLGQITLGLATTLITHVALLSAPFPLIRQIAVFSIFGLLGSFLTILVVAGPVKAPRPGSAKLPVGFSKRLFGQYEKLYRLPTFIKASLVLLLIVGSCLGLAKLHFGNDIRTLYTVSPTLGASEKEAASVLGLAGGGQYCIVRGKDAEEVLEREEALCLRLAEAEKSGALHSYAATSMLLPSRSRQAENYRLVADSLMPQARMQGQALGFSEVEFQKFSKDFTDRSGRTVGPEDFFRQGFSGFVRSLWIGRVGGENFSAVLLLGVKDKSALRQIGSHSEGVRYIDMVGDVSSVLDNYSLVALVLLGLAYVITFLGLWPFYGPRPAAMISAAPFLSSILAVAALGYFGITFNIFAVIALILILGTGVDYALFYYDGARHPQVTAIGIFLAMTTTFISYAALGFSTFTPAKTFGYVLTVGTAGSYLLAPIMARWGRSRPKAARHPAPEA